MPRNKNIKKVLLIGSGPIVIGQAAEFDYAGTQALTTLKKEGLEVVLVNSNPATIMTDSEMADRVYLEPLSVDVLKKIIETTYCSKCYIWSLTFSSISTHQITTLCQYHEIFILLV